MRKGLSILLVLSSASIVAFAEDPGSLAPVSAIVKSNPTLKDGIGLAGTKTVVLPASTIANSQTSASEAKWLERRIAKLQEAEYNSVNWNVRKADGTFEVKVYDQDGKLIPDNKVGDRLRAVTSQLEDARKRLSQVDDFPNLKKMPEFESQLKEINRLSKQRTVAQVVAADARNMHRSLLSNPRVQLEQSDYSYFSKVAREEQEAVKAFDSHVAKFRGNYIQPSKSALKIVEKAGVAVRKSGTSLSLVLGAGILAGAIEDRAVTAIDPGQDRALALELERLSNGTSLGDNAGSMSAAESRR